MKIEFHIREVSLTSSQRVLIEKKLKSLKRYIKDEPLVLDIYLIDESSPKKGGLDKAVELSAVFRDKKVFVREIDDEIMSAFAFAFSAFQRQIQRFHRKVINKSHEGTERELAKILKALRIRK